MLPDQILKVLFKFVTLTVRTLKICLNFKIMEQKLKTLTFTYKIVGFKVKILTLIVKLSALTRIAKYRKSKHNATKTYNYDIISHKFQF